MRTVNSLLRAVVGLIAGCSLLLNPVVGRSSPAASLAASVAVSADGRLLASGGWSGGEHGIIKIWDLAMDAVIRTLPGDNAENFLSVAFTPDGRRLVSSGEAFGVGIVRVWDLTTGQTVRQFRLHHGPGAAAVSPDGRWLVATGDGVHLWDVTTGRSIIDNPSWNQSPGVAVTPDGTSVVFAAGTDLLVLDVATDQVRTLVRDASGGVNTIAMTVDGRRVVSGGKDGTINLCEFTTGRKVRTFRGHTGAVESVAVSPDGRWLVSGGADRTVRIWGLRTGLLVHTLSGHASDVSSVVVVPDGRWAVSAGGEVNIWDLVTGRLIRTL